MKELYRFQVERVVEKVNEETKRKKKSKEKATIVVKFPARVDQENADYFFSQQYNLLIADGFLSRAMLSKKMGDIGGIESSQDLEELTKSLKNSMEASAYIQTFGKSNELDENQKEELEKAKETFAAAQKQILDYETNIRGLFAQTAENKAQEKLIFWMLYMWTFLEEKNEDEKVLVPLFEGDTYSEKREYAYKLEDTDKEDLSPADARKKEISDLSSEKLMQVLTIWANNMASNTEELKTVMENIFNSD